MKIRGDVESRHYIHSGQIQPSKHQTYLPVLNQIVDFNQTGNTVTIDFANLTNNLDLTFSNQVQGAQYVLIFKQSGDLHSITPRTDASKIFGIDAINKALSTLADGEYLVVYMTCVNTTEGFLASTISGSDDYVVSMNYADLQAAIAGSTLKTGQKYLISDYSTIYEQATTGIVSTSTQGVTDGLNAAIDPIIVTAKSTNTLNESINFLNWPQDIATYDPTEETLAGGITTKGSISRRVDTDLDVAADFDFRAVKFRRYHINLEQYNAATTYRRTAMVISGANVYVSVVDNNTGNSIQNPDFWLYVGANNETTPANEFFFTTIGAAYDTTIGLQSNIGFTVDNATFNDYYAFAIPGDSTNNTLKITSKGITRAVYQNTKLIRSSNIVILSGAINSTIEGVLSTITSAENVQYLNVTESIVNELSDVTGKLVLRSCLIGEIRNCNVNFADLNSCIINSLQNSSITRNGLWSFSVISGFLNTCKFDSYNLTRLTIGGNWSLIDIGNWRLTDVIFSTTATTNNNAIKVSGEMNNVKLFKSAENVEFFKTENCTFTEKLTNVVFPRTLTDWSLDKELNDVLFQIIRFNGQITLGVGTLPTNVVITHRYADILLTPTTEKLFYEVVDVDGLVTIAEFRD